MGRPKKSAPKYVEPEGESQELPEEEPDIEAEETGGKAISKAAAVRDALEQGEDGPEDGVAYIKKIHGIEMTRQSFSSYKAQEKARQAKKSGKPAPAAEAKPGRKPKAASPAAEGYLAPPPKPTPAGGSDLLDAMEAMKPLVASLGKEQVKRIVDLLG